MKSLVIVVIVLIISTNTYANNSFKKINNIPLTNSNYQILPIIGKETHLKIVCSTFKCITVVKDEKKYFLGFIEKDSSMINGNINWVNSSFSKREIIYFLNNLETYTEYHEYEKVTQVSYFYKTMFN